MQGLVTAGVWIVVYLLPLLLLVLLPLYLVLRFVLRRSRKPKTTPAA
jgi:flagellar biogenesis protein FliO